MARARNIKPGFFTNEELVELPFSTRLLFIGLWTLADREGRLEDKPKRIKMNIFPADTVDVDAALDELQASGFLKRYEAGGERYIQVLAFRKHQNPHRDEKASLIPAPEGHGASTVQAPCKDDANPADSLIPDSPIPETLNIDNTPVASAPVGSADAPPPSPPDRRKEPRGNQGVQDVFAHWQRVMNHPQAKLDEKRAKVIAKRLSDGYTVDELRRAVDGCRLTPHNMGQNDKRTVYDDIELICRDGSHVDRFIKTAQPQAIADPGLRRQIDVLQEWMETP